MPKRLLLLALQVLLGAAARVQYLTLFSSHQQVCPGRVLHVRVNYSASDARPTDGISFRVSWDTRFFTLVKKVRGHGAGYGECELNDFAHRRPSTQLDRHEWVQYVCADHRTRTSVSAKNVLPGTVQGVVQLTLVSRPDMPAGTKTQIKLVPGRLHGSGYEIVAQKPLVIEAKSGECSTDCEVSEFAEWSACTAKCGGGLRTRSRQVLQRAQGSGKACPSAWETAYCNQHRCDDLEVGSSVKSEPCLVGPWHPWGQCSNTCGGGLQHRTREVVLHGTPGAVCPRLHHARVCNTPMCPPSYEGWGGKHCERPDGKFVPHGWLGAGTGDNYCNLCDCSSGSYECQKKRCAPVRNKQGTCSHVSCHWRDGKMPKRVRLITGRLDTEGGLRFHTVINVRHSSAEAAGTHQNCAANKDQMTCACSCTGGAANPSIWEGAAATPPPQKAMLLSAPTPSPTPVPTYPRITTPGHKGAVTKLPATSADDDALDTGVSDVVGGGISARGGCDLGCVVRTGRFATSCDGIVYKLAVPSHCGAPGASCPIIMNVHGYGMDAEQLDAASKMSAAGNAAGFVVIMPSEPRGYWVPDMHHDQLIAFLREAKAHFRATRTHVAGFSQGAFAAWRMLCAASDLICSIAPLSASGMELWGAGYGSTCFSDGGKGPATARSVLYASGTRDPITPANNFAPQVRNVRRVYGMANEAAVTVRRGSKYEWFRYSARGVRLEAVSFDWAAPVPAALAEAEASVLRLPAVAGVAELNARARAALLAAALAKHTSHCIPMASGAALYTCAHYGGEVAAFDWGGEAVKFFAANPCVPAAPATPKAKCSARTVDSSVASDEMSGQAGLLAATKPPTPIAYVPAHAGSIVSSKLDDFDDEEDQPLDLVSPTPAPEAARRPTINQKIKIDTTAIIVPEHKKPEVALEQDFVDEQGDDGGLDNLAAINIPSNP
jgi:pimeloyl-ACP methyl ester carboxylesterase